MFGIFQEFWVMFVIVCHVPGHSGDPTGGNARNRQGCVLVETAPYGNIFSPRYGRRYPPSVVCKWTIKAPVGAKIHLIFNDFLIEKSRNCKNDFLLLFDGPNDKSRKVGRYCETSPEAFTSSTNYIHLEFRSDISLEFRGFHASYNITLATTSSSPEKSSQWSSRPKFLNTLLNVTAVEGSSVKLICEVDGTPEPAIKWNKNSGNLTEDQRIVIERRRFESLVKIGKVAVRDQGKYSCTGDNGVGPAITSHGWLIVTPRVLPVIKKTTENQTLAVGSKLSLHCEAGGPAPMKITWFEKDEELADEKCDKKVACKLNLTRIFVQDTVLTCEVANIAGTQSRNVHISVNGPPLITHAPKDQNVQLGLSVNFTCTAVGQPPLKISWRKDDEVVHDGITTVGDRSILKFTVTKNATVTCIVEGRDGLSYKQAYLIVGAQNALSNKSGDVSSHITLIVGAGGGVLLLAIIIIIFLVVRRRKRNKKVARGGDQMETTRENENLIPNPSFNQKKDEVDRNSGVEMIHYPRNDIAHCEDVEEGINIRMFLGRANDLPFASGEYKVLVKVLKDVNPSEKNKEEFEKEASLMAKLIHPNVVRLMAVCIKTAPLCLVFEYSEYGFLDEYLRECDQRDFGKRSKSCSLQVRNSYTELANVDRLSIAKQIAAGMQYLTDNGYIHQELRARNCMVFKDLQVKVTNLGLHWAKPEQNFFVMEPAEKKHFPVRWLSPEVILYGEYSKLADVWSFGVLVWEVFSDGQLPYSGMNDSEVVSYVRGNSVLPRPKTCPPNVYEVLKSCWEMTPLQRPNFSSLHETISNLHAGVAV